MKDLLKTTLLMANIAVVGIGLQGPATAQDLVADSQPGSVLVFPKFDEREGKDTHLRITNTHDSEYVGVRLDINFNQHRAEVLGQLAWALASSAENSPRRIAMSSACMRR